MSARGVFRVDDPWRGDLVAEVPLLDVAQAHSAVKRAAAAQREWSRVPLDERIALVLRFARALERRREEVAREISRQMGKPIVQARAEVATCVDRTRQLAALAPAALADERVEPLPGIERWISHEPVGVVLVIAAWNYPLLVPVNTVAAAVLAGDAVLIKHAPRTPLCAEAFAAAFREAGAPAALVAPLHVDHEVVAAVVSHPAIGYVAFTGSVPGGRAVYEMVARRRFVEVGLELGGKDAAWVAEDADPIAAAEQLVEGAMYNAGQSCCAVERIFVHRSLYDRFVEHAVRFAASWRLGDPLDEATTMGPMARPEAPGQLAAQVKEARAAGGRVLCGGFPVQVEGRGRFFAPTIVADAPNDCSLMQEESFGPVVGIAALSGDEEAVRHINASRYGLTASVWSRDPERARRIGARIEVGTVFLNRCDYLDPHLAWTGWKESGRGVSLSRFGFLPVTRRKSWHFRREIPGST